MKNYKSKTAEYKTLIFFLGSILSLFLSEEYIPNETFRKIIETFFSVIAVAIAADYLYNANRKTQESEEFVNTLKGIINEFDSEVSIKNGSNFSKHGLKSINDSIQLNLIFDALEDNDTLFWLDTYDPSYRMWFDSLIGAIKRGATINILAINPECSNSTHRASELGDLFPQEVFQNDATNFINILRRKKSELENLKYNGSLNIKVYDDLLCVPMYLIVRKEKPYECYTSFFLNKPTSYGFPHLKWVAGERSIIDNFYAYLVNKWEKHS